MISGDSNLVYKVFGLALSLLILIVTVVILIVIIRAHIQQTRYAQEANKVPDTGLVDVEVVDVMFPKLREVTELALKRSKTTLTNAKFYRDVTSLARMKTVLESPSPEPPTLQRQDSNLSTSVLSSSRVKENELITPVEIGRTRSIRSPSMSATSEC